MDPMTKETITNKMLARDIGLQELQNFALYNNLDGINKLLRQGIPINGRALNGLTCLEVAIKKESKILPRLINRGASQFHLSDAIITAVKEGNIDQLGQMLWRDQNLVRGRDEWGNTLLHIAAEENNESMIALLKERGVEESAENQYEETYLEVAEVSQMKETSLLDLQECAADNDRGGIDNLLAEGTPINGRAKKNGLTCLEVVKAENSVLYFDLINRGASDKHLPDAIITAVEKVKVDEVGNLLSENKNLAHGRDKYGNTLLHIAAEENNGLMIDLLKQKGVDQNAQNQYGETYLQVAELNQEISKPQSTASASVSRR